MWFLDFENGRQRRSKARFVSEKFMAVNNIVEWMKEYKTDSGLEGQMLRSSTSLGGGIQRLFMRKLSSPPPTREHTNPAIHKPTNLQVETLHHQEAASHTKGPKRLD